MCYLTHTEEYLRAGENIAGKVSPGRWERATWEWLAGVSLPPTKISVSPLNRMYYAALRNDHPFRGITRIIFHARVISPVIIAALRSLLKVGKYLKIDRCD